MNNIQFSLYLLSRYRLFANLNDAAEGLYRISIGILFQMWQQYIEGDDCPCNEREKGGRSS